MPIVKKPFYFSLSFAAVCVVQVVVSDDDDLVRWSTATTCNQLSLFYDDCIEPVESSIKSSMEIEEICEVVVWGVGTGPSSNTHVHFEVFGCVSLL
jgi:hypothetical protein